MSIKANFPIVSPSIVMDFANSKTLDPRIIFTRTTTGTYVGADGLIKTAGVDEARFDHDPATGESLGLLIEESRTNLVKHSENFLSFRWTNIGNPPTLAADQVTAPDGTTTADKLSIPSGSGAIGLQSSILTGIPVGTQITSSCFCKAAEHSYVRIEMQGGGNIVSVNVDLSDGSLISQVNSPTAYKIEPYVNDWYRISVTSTTATSAASALRVYLVNASGDISFTGTVGNGIYVWGGQHEEGMNASSYIPTNAGTTVTRAADIAEITGTDFSKTNLLQYSERFYETWVTSGTVVPNATTAPDGTLTADKVFTDSSASFARLGQTLTVANGVYTLSFYAKAGDTTSGKCFMKERNPSGNSANCTYNLNNGTITVNSDGSGALTNQGIESAGNGWYRIFLTFNKASGTNLECRIMDFANFSNKDGLFFWGAQLEEGSVLTDYTPSVETFVSRASSATYVDDATGLIKTTPVNLLRYSEELDNSAWSKHYSSITPNVITAPDGSITADQFNRTTTTVSNYVYQSIGKGSAVSKIYTFSIYFKKDDARYVSIRLQGNYPSRSDVVFDLDTGTISVEPISISNFSNSSANIIALSDGWYRCNLTATSDNHTSIKPLVSCSAENSFIDGTSTVINSVYLWGAQLEEGSTATEYIPTGSTISGAARYENGELILEEARTNIIDKNTSNYNSIWFNQTPPDAYNNAGIAPDGTNTAFATTSYDGVNRGQKNYTVTADTNDYTFSIFIKSTGGQGQYVTSNTGFYNGNSDTSGQVAYDFATDTVGHGYSRKLYANGWVRIWKTYTNTNRTLFLVTNRNSTSLDMLFWGAQVEQGSYPSSLIITPSGDNVTRAADVSTSALGVDGFYNHSEGTFYAEFSAPEVTLDVDGRAFTVSEGTATTGALSIGKRRGDNQFLTGRYADGAELIVGSIDWSNFQKSALSYNSTNYTVAANGSSSGTTDSTTVNANLDRMFVGSRRSETNKLNGHIKRLTYYPNRLTNSQLQNLTK